MLKEKTRHVLYQELPRLRVIASFVIKARQSHFRRDCFGDYASQRQRRKRRFRSLVLFSFLFVIRSSGYPLLITGDYPLSLHYTLSKKRQSGLTWILRRGGGVLAPKSNHFNAFLQKTLSFLNRF